MISQLGLMPFMFMVGLEFDGAMLRDRAKASLLVSHASIALPFALGSAVAVGLWPTYTSADVEWLLTLGPIALATLGSSAVVP